MGEQCAKQDRKMERNVREMYRKIIKKHMDCPVLAASEGRRCVRCWAVVRAILLAWCAVAGLYGCGGQCVDAGSWRGGDGERRGEEVQHEALPWPRVGGHSSVAVLFCSGHSVCGLLTSYIGTMIYKTILWNSEYETLGLGLGTTPRVLNQS